MRIRAACGGLFAAVLVTSLLTGSGGAAARPAAAGQQHNFTAHAGGHKPQTVTLISGDRVTVHPGGQLSVTPREGVHFLTHQVTHGTEDHRYVIPSDALPLLRDNRIDRRLFDVTTLAGSRYYQRGGLPLIVTGASAAQARGTATGGLTGLRPLPAIDGFAATASLGELADYWQSLTGAAAAVRTSSPSKIWLDGIRQPSLDVSVPQIGAPSAWDAGYDGTGVTVAVLDTGIDSAHPDLAGKIADARNFGGEYEDELDRVGHGTHVASTIAGTGAASGGKYTGVAPGAALLDGKVCVEFGCAESWILDGMYWAAESGAEVVNMSLGGYDGPEIDPIEQAVNDLTADYDMLFVIAAGNSGPGNETLGSPASADAALAVGAVTKTDELIYFSSRGPRVGDAALKPEITAPGVEIVAANSKDGFLGEPGEMYTTLSGTSMATPHVAGAAAILAQQHPGLTAPQLKATLMASAEPNSVDGPFAQGAGRVDVARAITQEITTSPAAISLGRQAWPHDDDPILKNVVTYRNSGTSDITLGLTLDEAQDNPAPAGTFSLDATSVTVPVGGSASVTLTTDTTIGDVTGLLGGWITAGAGDVQVKTPFAVDREGQRYAVDLVHTGRDGEPTSAYFTVAVNLETFEEYLVFYGDPVVSLRVAPGPYFMFTWIDGYDEEADRYTITQLTWPTIEVNEDQTIQLDAREGQGFDIGVPVSDVDPLLAAVDATLEGDEFGIGTGVVSGDLESLFTAHMGPKPVAGFSSQVQYLLDNADGDVTVDLLFRQEGSFFTGFTKQVKKKELARIEMDFARHATDLGMFFRFPGNGGWASGAPFAVPAQRTAYVSAGVPWETEFDEIYFGDDGWDYPYSWFREFANEYRGGHRYSEQWNRAAFGPALPETPWGTDVGRWGDEIFSFPALLGDGTGRVGSSEYTTGHTSLYRDDELVGEFPEPYGYFLVDPEQARYRVEHSITRGAPGRLSTQVDVAWEFTSANAGEDELTALPVTALGFAPRLDDQNTARAGRIMVIPVSARPNPGSAAAKLESLSVQMSSDDGGSWQDARVISFFGYHLVILKNPADAGFVSLRAQAEDRSGNTVEQTIIRAYEVR